MTFDQIIKLLVDQGLSVVLVAFLVFALYKMGEWYNTLANNHMHELKEGQDKMLEEQKMTNTKLETVIELLKK
jgi:cell division protein FtsB